MGFYCTLYIAYCLVLSLLWVFDSLDLWGYVTLSESRNLYFATLLARPADWLRFTYMLKGSFQGFS
jgi:hypothetical protein